MEDPVYAEKYSKPYPSDHVNKIARMMKQSMDARFGGRRNGAYVGLGVFGAEVGGLRMPTSYSEVRGEVKGQLNSGAGTLGVDVSARLQTPTRLAPFVGIGGYVGGGDGKANDDDIDNDRDGMIDESHEQTEKALFAC